MYPYRTIVLLASNKPIVPRYCTAHTTGQEYEARLSKTLLPRVTCEAVVKRAAEFALSASCVVKVRCVLAAVQCSTVQYTAVRCLAYVDEFVWA